MPNFDIEKKNLINKTFRVAKIMGDFDVKGEHSNERFTGAIDLSKNWQIGLIVGTSGTGKSTIAKSLFPDDYIVGFDYNENAVIDNMPQNVTVEEIEKMFYAVGFGSVPSWLKPYNVLSTGEKMRVDLARALLERENIVFDEFTSVVDRNVAKTTCVAINKAIKKTNKKFIAVSCHYDIIDWLQPDWIFDTSTMQQVFTTARDLNNVLASLNAGKTRGKHLGDIII